MKKLIMVVLILTSIYLISDNTFARTGTKIVKKMETALKTKTTKALVIMKVYSGSGTYRTVKMKSYSKGLHLAYNYYYYPRNIKGMKYLSRRNNIWVYYPLTGRVRKLPNHMKKRPISGVGGDFSASDMQLTEWTKKYKSKF